jgi:hypothetical protein
VKHGLGEFHSANIGPHPHAAVTNREDRKITQRHARRTTYFFTRPIRRSLLISVPSFSPHPAAENQGPPDAPCPSSRTGPAPREIQLVENPVEPPPSIHECEELVAITHRALDVTTVDAVDEFDRRPTNSVGHARRDRSRGPPPRGRGAQGCAKSRPPRSEVALAYNRDPIALH